LGTLTVVAPLSALSILANILLAYFFLGEKQHLAKKIIAIICVIIGIILLSM
jgi:uncharacterized membrane protein